MRRPLLINICASALVVAATAAPIASVSADEIEDFYKGKNITFVVGFGAGDGFDLLARLVARHIVKHIPGEPGIIVQNMPGASSLIALEHLLNRAPRDGTAIGMISPNITLQPLLRPERVKYDFTKANWIGSVSSDFYNCALWTTDTVSLEESKDNDLILGSTSTTGATHAGNNIFNRVLGLNAKIVAGYKTMNELNLAAERGEISGHCGVMGTTLRALLWKKYQTGELKVIVTAALDRDQALPNVPNAFDLAKTDEDRQLLTMLAGPWHYGRPMLAPPDVPATRLKALRHAFDKTMTDPGFMKELESIGVEIRPLTADQIASTVNKIYSTPKDVIERAKPLFGVE